jgi:hypothetical protein
MRQLLWQNTCLGGLGEMVSQAYQSWNLEQVLVFPVS